MALSASPQIDRVSIKEIRGSRLDNQTSKFRGFKILEEQRLEDSGRESDRRIQLGALVRQAHERLSAMAQTVTRADLPVSSPFIKPLSPNSIIPFLC